MTTSLPGTATELDLGRIVADKDGKIAFKKDDLECSHAGAGGRVASGLRDHHRLDDQPEGAPARGRDGLAVSVAQRSPRALRFGDGRARGGEELGRGERLRQERDLRQHGRCPRIHRIA